MSTKRRMGNGILRVGEALYRTADGISAIPFLGQRQDLPEPIQVEGKTIDTVADLVAFTGLSNSLVRAELRRRRQLNFRAEWFSTPRQLREDRWFYLSSKTYLFANAAHFTDNHLVDFISSHVEGQRILEFGGGTGQLALRLAGHGHHTLVAELSSLQRDFLRFRIHRHNLQLVEVVDFWQPFPTETFDAVIAMDVIEHLPDAANILDNQLLPSLDSNGVLVEDSPFEANTANPMHHPDFGMEQFMADRSFEVVGRHANARAWQRAGSL